MGCSHTKSKVLDKRIYNQYNYRRRQCLECNERFSTYELPVSRGQLKKILKPDTVEEAKEAIVAGLIGELCRG